MFFVLNALAFISSFPFQNSLLTHLPSHYHLAVFSYASQNKWIWRGHLCDLNVSCERGQMEDIQKKLVRAASYDERLEGQKKEE